MYRKADVARTGRERGGEAGPEPAATVGPDAPGDAASAGSAVAAESMAARIRGRLATIVVAHAVTDFFSALIIPLLSVLEGRVGISAAQGAVLIGLGSLTSGLIQPVVALVGDRHDTRWLGTVGLAVAAVCIGSVGFASEYWHLVVIQALGAAGVGAFHPAAAAVMGHLAGRRRSVGVAVFFAAGMIGGVAGSVTAPWWAARFGVPSLAWTIIPGLLTVGLLAWATHTAPHRHEGARARHANLPASERRLRWLAIGVLYVSNALRFVVNMALVQMLTRLAELEALVRRGAIAADQALVLTPEQKTALLDAATREQASTYSGPLQAAMQVGMGVAGLTLGLTVRERWQRRALVWVPIVGAVGVAALPHSPTFAAQLLLAVAAGAGYAGTMPLSIALAQRLLPHRTSLASGLMMGGAWSVAAVGPPLAQWLYEHLGMVATAWIVAGTLALAGAIVWLIPGRLFRYDVSGH